MTFLDGIFSNSVLKLRSKLWPVLTMFGILLYTLFVLSTDNYSANEHVIAQQFAAILVMLLASAAIILGLWRSCRLKFWTDETYTSIGLLGGLVVLSTWCVNRAWFAAN